MKEKIIDRLTFLVVISAFLLRIWNINWGLPYIYNTDEYKLVNYTLKMGATRSLNPKFFIYPSFYLYFMLFVYFIIFIVGKILGYYASSIDFGIKFLKDPSVIYIATRSFSAFFGFLVVLFSYILAKKMYDKKIGILTALQLTFLPSFVEYSHYAKIEMFSTFLVVIFVYFLYEYFIRNEIKYLYLSCLFLGLAISSRYLPAVCIPAVIFVIFKKKLKLKYYVFCILIIICAFLIGTPFALLDYKTFFKDVFYGHAIGNEVKRNFMYSLYLTVVKNYLFLGSETFILGLLGISGVVYYILFKSSFKEKLLLIIFFGYFLISAFHYHTEWHYVAGSYPFLCILASVFVENFRKYKFSHKLIFAIYTILLFIAAIESIKFGLSLGIKDTRTEAKEWIENNIPYGSKILIDMHTYSPQIKMTKSQLELLYKKAVELNHYKKEYLYYQILAHPGGNYGYEIYQVWRPFHEVSTIKHEVEEAQKMQRLIDVKKGLDYVKSLGIQYVIINSINYSGYPLTFYKEVEQKGLLLKKFVPKNKFQPGPTIKIYKIQW
ncbi:MAG: glycosyltransferase family 39 protein [Endomicrobiia bacterium]